MENIASDFDLLIPTGEPWSTKYLLKPKPHSTFRFIDVFAGIGGFRLALQDVGGRCVCSIEKDKFARQTYLTNFSEKPMEDIFEVDPVTIPDHEILTAGFPCQPYSSSGQGLGLRDPRGQTIFPLLEIISKKRPQAVILENVVGFARKKHSHSREYLLSCLRDELGYYFPEPEILSAADFGLPQKRRRVFVVGFRSDLGIDKFSYPKESGEDHYFGHVRHRKAPAPSYYLSERFVRGMRRSAEKHKERGNGFRYAIIENDQLANCLMVGGDGWTRNLVKEYMIPDLIENPERGMSGLRRMTPREWARIQGFPEAFQIPVSNAQAYKQFGNAVAVPVARSVAHSVVKYLKAAGAF